MGQFGNCELKDMMITDGLTDAFSNIHMGVTAENVAKEKGYTQADQDSFAFDSQLKCKAAQEAGHFDQEIVSVSIPGKKAKVNDHVGQQGFSLALIRGYNQIIMSGFWFGYKTSFRWDIRGPALKVIR